MFIWYNLYGDSMDGIFLIDKDKGCTSRDVVNEIIKKVETKKVGHTGTLDPLATGVLVVCVGKATKLVDMLTSEEKEYIAEITLGLETDSLDITGNILKEEKVNITKEEIINVLNNFKGEYDQEVPAYSAIKINGKKLYEYAREGIDIELPKRNVSIKEIELVSDIKYENNRIIFSIKCLVSKGTYIRSLVRDIAHKLNTIGVMSELRRTKLGKFNINDCKFIDEIKLSDMLNVSEVLTDYTNIKVDESLKKDILNGKIIDNIYGSEKIVFLDKDNKVLAIYKRYEKDNNKIKPYIVLGGI